MDSSGGVAEWLGRGLQSPVLRFESGRRLKVVGTFTLTVHPLLSRSLEHGNYGRVRRIPMLSEWVLTRDERVPDHVANAEARLHETSTEGTHVGAAKHERAVDARGPTLLTR
jgi:hypothetical protein